MSHIERSALVFHSADKMFELVNDVERYPDFLNYCSDAKVHEAGEEQMLAEVALQLGGLSKSFTTRNTLRRPERIELELVDGPFESLSGRWQFRDFGSDGSKISLTLDYSVKSGLAPFKLGFSKLADSLVKQFCERADALYGEDDTHRSRPRPA